MPAIPPPRVRLGDARVSLRLSAERDIPEILIAHQDDGELHRRLGLWRAPSGAELGRADELAPAEREAGRRLELTITEAGADVCLGQVVLQRVDWDNLRGELLVWVAPAARRRGYGSAALRLTAGWLFAVTDLARIELLGDPGDQALLGAARAAGFQREGVLRGYRAERRGGARRDSAVLSVLPGEPA